MTTEPITAVELLREGGLRVTSQRIAVLDALVGGHVDVETLTTRARARLGTLSSQAVYEMLNRFLEVELVRKVPAPFGPVLYETDTTVHDHVVCDRCHRVENIPATTRRPPLPAGWSLRETMYIATCPACTQQDGAAGVAADHSQR
ncbi:transcriptional repressor [Actinoplanes sp. NPDC051411]|uniref:Fur family transcriptional regulator n=1 Tax=Actinoplanes sp. NPDC051411 TaxID=3155522 RepID=UPI00343AA952